MLYLKRNNNYNLMATNMIVFVSLYSFPERQIRQKKEKEFQDQANSPDFEHQNFLSTIVKLSLLLKTKRQKTSYYIFLG